MPRLKSKASKSNSKGTSTNVVSVSDISAPSSHEDNTNGDCVSKNRGEPKEGQRSACPNEEAIYRKSNHNSVYAEASAVNCIYDTPTKDISKDVIDGMTTLNPSCSTNNDSDNGLNDKVFNDDPNLPKFSTPCFEDNNVFPTDVIDDSPNGFCSDEKNCHIYDEQLIRRINKPNQNTLSTTDNPSTPRVTRHILNRNTINRDSNCGVRVANPHRNNSDLQDYSISTPTVEDCTITNLDDVDDSSHRNHVISAVHNNHAINNSSECFSYSTRRRHVRHLKQYIFKLGSLDMQACILLDLLNDFEMKNVVQASGIKSPKENKFNEHIVNQVLKQINRSSSKSSTRGRVNDDRQSFKINMTAAILRSPTANISPSLSNKNYINMLYTKTSLSRSSARKSSSTKEEVNQC